MSDVDTWSPLDESNTSPPPDGWPEFMLPSAVNNSARAMMGAVRRLYDKQVDGSLVLPYLKLSGGTVTGNVTINGGLTTSAFTSGNISVATVTCSGNINASGAIAAANHVNAAGYWLAGASFATRSGNDTQILDNAGQWTFLTRSSAPENVYANTTHTFAARNNAATFATLNSAGLNLAVPLAAGAITASGIVSTGGIQANATGATAFYAPNGGIQIAGGASFGGTV
jgi:hypothetical protein